MRRTSQVVPRLSLSGRRGATAVPLLKLNAECEQHPEKPSTCQAGCLTFAYEVGEVLGQGSMALVRRAVRRSDRKEVAVKCVRSIDEEHRDFTRKEYDLMRNLSHPAIVSTYSKHENSCNIWLCMEYCADGCVESYVERNGVFAEESGQQLLWQFLTGVDYLHCVRVVHRDLKPSNIILTRSASALKICDFNSAKQIGEAESVDHGGSVMLTDRGSQPYKAPEIRFGALWNERVDVWSYGLCAYFMFRGSLPFNTEARKVHAHWLAGKNPHIFFGNMTEAMQKLVLECLSVSMHDRPAAMELLLHPAFATKESQRIKSDSSSAAVSDKTSLLPEIMLSSCGLLSLCSLHGKSCLRPSSSDVDVDLSPTFAGSGWQEQQYRKQALRHLTGSRWNRTKNTSDKGRGFRST